MDINKKLVGDIANHIVSVHALNPNILINKYKITRNKLDAIIDIFIEAKIIEFVSYTEPYKVIPLTKEELSTLINSAHGIIERKLSEGIINKKVKTVDEFYRDSFAEILNSLKRIEDKLAIKSEPPKNMRINRRSKRNF